MSEFVPPLTFERLDDGTIRVTDNTIQDAVRDVVKRLADAKETALKEAIKSLGWIVPEDIAAHDARIASDALKQAAQDMRSAKRLYDSWNLTDPENPEISYSPDRWLEVYADRRGDEYDVDTEGSEG